MKHLLTFLIATVLFTSCSMNEIPDKLIPKDADKYCKKYMKELKAGNIDYCYAEMDTQFQDDKAHGFFQGIYEKIKDQELLDTRVISTKWQSRLGQEGKNIILQYEYKYDDFWLYTTFQLIQKGDDFTVYTFNIQPTNQSLAEIHEFTLKGKKVQHYLFLVFLVLIPIFIMVSVAFAVKTPLNRKWLWIIYMLIGWCAINLNWTTGEMGFSFITFKLLGAGFSKSGIIAPWIVSLGIPIGAIHFWIKRVQIKEEQELLERLEKIQKENEEKNDTTTKL